MHRGKNLQLTMFQCAYLLGAISVIKIPLILCRPIGPRPEFK